MHGQREIESLLREMRAAQVALRQARLRLSRSDARPVAPVVEGSWEWARRILHSRAARLREIPGVVGYSLATREIAGAPSDEPCLAVFVERKLDGHALRARGERALPRKIGTGSRAIAVDVVELGRLQPHAATGAEATRASLLGAEAAMTRLADGQPLPVPGLGTLRAWRPTVFPEDGGMAVRLAGRVSGVQHGVLASPLAHLPGLGFDVALLAHIHSAPGDSGAPLVDPEGLLLGFLVGRVTGGVGTLRVFRPAAALMRARRGDGAL